MEVTSPRQFMSNILTHPDLLESILEDCKRLSPSFPEEGDTVLIWHLFQMSGFPLPLWSIPYTPFPQRLSLILQQRGFRMIPREQAPVIGDLYGIEDEQGITRRLGVVAGQAGYSRGYILGVDSSVEAARVRKVSVESVTYWLHT